MKWKITTIPEFYTILSDYFEKNENDLSSLTLKDTCFLLGEAFMLSGKKREALLEMVHTEEQIMNTIVMNSIIGGMRNE